MGVLCRLVVSGITRGITSVITCMRNRLFGEELAHGGALMSRVGILVCSCHYFAGGND